MRFCAFVVLAGLTALAAGCGMKKDTGGDGGGGGGGGLDGKWSIADVEFPFGAGPDLAKMTPEEKKQSQAFEAKMKEQMRKEFADVEVTVQGTTISATKPGEAKAPKGTFKLYPDKSPKEFDITPDADGGGKSETFQGIYKLEGDTLTAAVAGPGSPRPKEFKSVAPTMGKKDEGVILVVLKRKP